MTARGMGMMNFLCSIASLFFVAVAFIGQYIASARGPKWGDMDFWRIIALSAIFAMVAIQERIASGKYRDAYREREDSLLESLSQIAALTAQVNGLTKDKHHWHGTYCLVFDQLNEFKSRAENAEAELAALREEAKGVRERALLEAAAIAGGATYNGDYHTAVTDARDSVARWVESQIRERILDASK